MRTGGGLLLGVVLLGSACGGGDDTAVESVSAETVATAAASTTEFVIPSTPRSATTAPPATTARETKLAVSRCIDAMSTVGLGVMLRDWEDVETAQQECDEARINLEVDGRQDAVVLVAKRLLDLSFLVVKGREADIDGETITAEQAGEFDSSYFQWVAELEAAAE